MNKKIFKTFSAYLFVLFLTEVMFRIVNKLDILSLDLAIIFFTSSLISIILTNLTILLRGIYAKIFTYVILVILIGYIFLQLGFVNFLGAYASFSTSSQLEAVWEFIPVFLTSFSLKYFLIFLPFLTLIVFNVFKKHYFKYNFKKTIEGYNKKSPILFLLIVYVFSVLGISFLVFNNNSKKELFFSPENSHLSVKEFGVLFYTASDIVSIFNDKEDFVDEIIIDKSDDFVNTSRMIDDTIWLSILEKEKNPTFKVIHEYLLNRDIPEKNDYTGLFKDKNLIIVMLESVNDVITFPEYFPNFAKLMENGIYFDNNYSPRNTNPTGNNEFSGITSLYSINNVNTINAYSKNVYPYSIFSMFKKEGYDVVSMHNHYDQFYRRSIAHYNMGVDKYYGVQSLDIPYSTTWHTWASDSDLAVSAMNILKTTYLNNPFMLWLTMVTPHFPYGVSSKYGDLYIDEFKDLKIPLSYKRYLSKVKVSDDALGILLDELTDLNLLDDTVIVVYADHYPYVINSATQKALLNRSFDNIEKEKVPFVISNPSLKGTINHSYTSFLNIAPTIFNLFDLEYDPRIYFGEDLFSQEFSNIIVTHNRSWKGDLGFYNIETGRVLYNGDEKYESDDIKKLNEKIKNDVKISNLIVKYDYFNKLQKEIEKYKEMEEENEISDS